ncbi:MAG: hypothetical protein IJR90_08730 [Clostridia bacterium]|nr:hypothetical protein [Clostridia bacterium]
MKKANLRLRRSGFGGSGITKSNAVFLLIIGVVLGTVFTFGMKYWNMDVSEDETVKLTGTYQSYHIRSGAEGLVWEKSGKEITVCFSDIENKFVDSSCNTDALREKLSSITPGTKVDMLIHPNSPTIMELSVDGDVILSFEEVRKALKGSTTGFMLLGLLLYAEGAYAGYLLLTEKYYGGSNYSRTNRNKRNRK